MMKKKTQSFWKSLSFFILLSSTLISCQSSPKYTLEDSRFIGKMEMNDTLKVINERFYCEDGERTESYYFYYPNQSKDMECHYQMEYGWGKEVAEQGIIKEETYKVSSKTIKFFLKFLMIFLQIFLLYSIKGIKIKLFKNRLDKSRFLHYII